MQAGNERQQQQQQLRLRLRLGFLVIVLAFVSASKSGAYFLPHAARARFSQASILSGDFGERVLREVVDARQLAARLPELLVDAVELGYYLLLLLACWMRGRVAPSERDRGRGRGSDGGGGGGGIVREWKEGADERGESGVRDRSGQTIQEQLLKTQNKAKQTKERQRRR